jgi:hypothetical protein
MSIESSLRGINDEPELDELFSKGFYRKRHIPAAMVREVVPREVWDGYFKFAFVRNPWDWFVSLHNYSRQKRGLEVTARPLEASEVMETYQHTKQFRGMPWSDSACQHAQVCDETGCPLVDFVGRFENLREDFDLIQSHAGISVGLPHLNSGLSVGYRSYYTKETKELIGRLYFRDIEIFGYEF